MRNNKVEGYWYSKLEPQYPMPVPNMLTEEQAKMVFFAIKRKELDAQIDWAKGSSYSRIEEGVRVGSGEYSYRGWSWPENFAEHYVLKHRVRPSDDFLTFLGVTL